MFRLFAIFLMLATISLSSLAHASAGGCDSQAPSSHAMHDMAGMDGCDHENGAKDEHADHSACVLGHCAVSCGALTTGYNAAHSVDYSLAVYGFEQFTRIGALLQSDPPPPKV